MRIVLDARPLTHPQAGGFRSYVRALLSGLRECGTGDTGDIDLILYVDRELGLSDQQVVPPGAAVRVLTPSRLRADLLLFPRAVREDCPDLVHGTTNYLPRLTGAKTTLTIHDAMGVKRYPWDTAVPRTPRERFINRYWSRMTRLSAQSARQIVTDSRGAAQELREALRLPDERFTVVYPGVPSIALPNKKAASLPRPYTVLAIASPDPRKNIDLLYRALSAEAKQFPGSIPPRLHLVCSSDGAARRADTALTEHGIRDACLLRDVNDTALAGAYASAGVFAWPSRHEGFGLPPLEAMRGGCPVASSRAPVMPEVLGDAPLYFDPDNPAELAESIAHLLGESPEVRLSRVLVGQERVGRFTCRRMADETIAVWKSALEASRP